MEDAVGNAAASFLPGHGSFLQYGSFWSAGLVMAVLSSKYLDLGFVVLCRHDNALRLQQQHQTPVLCQLHVSRTICLWPYP